MPVSGQVRRLGAYVLVVVATAAGFFAIGRESDRATREARWDTELRAWEDRVATCERLKSDRAIVARALRAQADYLNLVLDARSVMEDVKRAARVNQATQIAAAIELESRTGVRLNCRVVNRRPTETR